MRENSTGSAFQRQFFARFPALQPLMELFEHIPGVCFYAKDKKSRFVRLNRANLAVYGVSEEESLLGRSDRDFHPPSLAEGYIAEDQRVMESGPVLNQTWLVPFLNGPMQWFVSSKVQLVGPRGECVGVCGEMYPIATPKEQLARFQRLAPAIRHLEEHFCEHIQLSTLADHCDLSSTHVHRLFQRLFAHVAGRVPVSASAAGGASPAGHDERAPLGDSPGTGFFDQSHFTKRFRKMTGMTPTQFRKTFQE